MVEPQDSKEEEKKAQKKSHQAWITANGFQVSGLHSNIENQHQDLRLPAIGGLNEVHGEEEGLKWRVLTNLFPPNLLAPLI